MYILTEFKGSKETKTEFETLEDVKAYVIPKYNIDMENTYEEFPMIFESVYFDELEKAKAYDELAGCYDEYSYGYYVEESEATLC